MIDVSLCPSPWVQKKMRPYKLVVGWLETLKGLPAGQDASGGKLKAALTSRTPLFVTSYQYAIEDSFTCLNVMVDRQDYRLQIGFDDTVIRVETLDARAARAQTKLERENEANRNAAALALQDVPADTGAGSSTTTGGHDGYGNAPMDLGNGNYANNPNPYNVPIRA